jgi:erythromycin esterase-like protein
MDASLTDRSTLLQATLDDLLLAAQPLRDGEAGDYDALLKLIGEARLVLLGVSCQGTHELFRARAELTTRLIKEKGFTTLALAANAAARDRLDSFARGRSEDVLAADALRDVAELPRWLWRNAEMLDFLGWLRTFNDQFSGDAHKVRVCGLDALDGVDVEGRDKVVVWEHSRQAGDSRATDQGGSSMGRLARERLGNRAMLVNFSTYTGSFVAASSEGGQVHRQSLRPAAPDSVEALCHAIVLPRFYLPLRGAPERLVHFLREPRLERMVDAVFSADDTAGSCYVRARLADQFDAVVHFDETRSLEPIDPTNTR